MFQTRNQHLRSEFEREALPHLDSLFGMAMRLTADKRDAEDLVQDSLVRAYRAYHRFEKGTFIKAWLFKILTNTFYNQRRQQQHIQRVVSEAEVGQHHDRFVSQASTAAEDGENGLLETVALEQIHDSLNKLPESFRVVVTLSDLHEFSYREIAEILDCPVGTVMSRLYRGRKMLQEHLRDQARDAGIGISSERDHDIANLNEYRRQRSDVGQREAGK